MVTHVVMFTLKEPAGSNREKDVADIRVELANLLGVVPGLRTIGFDPDLDDGAGDGHWDAVLVSTHDDRAALDGYQVHPAHVEVAAFIGARILDRVTVDFAG